jgi:predicted amidohydrolase
MHLNLALAQINTKLGDVQFNLEKHLDFIQQAKAQKADLILFPELSLTGYYLQDLAVTVAHRPLENDPIFKPLFEASKDIDLVVGFVDEDYRHRFYIASAYLSGGRLLHVHHKLYLPTYALFDEGRFFTRGDSLRAFDTALAGSACSSAKISGTPLLPIFSGWMERTYYCFHPHHRVAA